ncbi:MAG TPA: ABC transporter substrate-binding protein [Acidimicrobiales bacterium]|nr:ABC transporter substrate-binding protein [Acidimicrobiales bacterium]
MLSSGAIRRSGQSTRKVTTKRAVASAALTLAAVSAAVGGGAVAGASAGSGNSGSGEATGTPVTIGMITDAGGSGGIGTSALVEQGAKAAVAYVNSNLGGLEGHKVNLYICENQNTPAGGQTCANDMVQKGVVAVVEPFTGQGQTEVPTIAGAGIPYIAISGGSTAELTTPGAFDITGGFPAYIGAEALSAKQHGIKKVAFLVENVPSAIQGTQELGGIVYKAAGVGLDVVPVNPGTADASPQLQSAVSSGADAVGVIGDVTMCSTFLKAYNTLSLHLPRWVLSTCQDPSILGSSTLDKALAGSYITTLSQSSKAQNAEYAAIIKKYAKGVSTNPNVSSNQSDGVVPVLTLAAVMKGSTQPVTAAGIKAAMASTKNVPIPMAGGLTFTCNGTAIPLLKDVCSSSAAIGVIQAGKAGKVTHITTYNPTSLF